MAKKMIFRNLKRHIILPLALIMLSGGLYAQTEFPGGDYWSLDAGFGMTDILVKGTSYQFVVDPKIWLSPPLMIGNHLDVNYSTDEILSLENQLYLRWNFLRLGKQENKFNVFVQGGVGLIAASKKGESELYNDPTLTRGSFMLDTELGMTIPLGSSWHIEPAVRVGYPHIAGASITMGYKMPFRGGGNVQSFIVEADKEKYRVNTNSKSRDLNEVVLNGIAGVEFILFGADIGQYNVEIDRATQFINDMALNEIANMLKMNPDFRVRIEGHANPILTHPKEKSDLMNLSQTRANVIAGQLKARGISENRMIVIAYGGSRPVTLQQDYCNRNRRVELIVFKDAIKRMGSK